MDDKIAIETLSKDYLLHVDMLECIRRRSAEILFASPDAVLLIDIPSQIYMLSAQNSNIAENLISKLPNDIEIIVTHEEFTYKLLLKKYNYNNTMICHNTVYTEKMPIATRNQNLDIKLLTKEYKDIIIRNYSKIELVDVDYIEDRLESQVMLGAFINDNLCGFIGSHKEGSLGMLEVFAQYRGKGIGGALQIAATNDALANNRYPYGQVVEDNLVSAGLQKKLGFELSQNRVYWLMK